MSTRLVSRPYVPPLSGTTLAGERRELPDDLRAETFVAIGFEPGHQAAIAEWIEIARGIGEQDGGVPVMAVAIMPNAMGAMRPVITGALKAGLRDPAVRAATMLVFCDVPGCSAALGLSDTRQPVVVMADADGRVGWRAVGAPSVEKAAELGRYLGGRGMHEA